MDTLRGYFSGSDSGGDREYDLAEDDVGSEPPPSPVGQDERRMQVRAYNFWASLLSDRQFPAIDELNPQDLPDFGPYSVLLDFTVGVDNPAIRYLGAELAEECAGDRAIASLADVPARSLLSRITDHYMQILANQAPIGFEAEFVNQRGATILYRGILLPFSGDGAAIDYIYGVINWKEIADQHASDALLLEIGQVLDDGPMLPPVDLDVPPMPEWADGPVDDNVLELLTPLDDHADPLDWPAPAFGTSAMPAPAPSRGAVTIPIREAPVSHVSFNAFAAIPAAAPTSAPAIDPERMALADWLASARELAQAAKGGEERSRQALYAAIGRAYDFSLAAAEAPADFQELLADAGVTAQDRAPMTPVVKLVFGAEYDKTRLTEYASALAHAHHLGLVRGTLADFLSAAEGGLKGVVNAERQRKRAESGKVRIARDTPREGLARKLRTLEPRPLADVSHVGNEFTLLVARRLDDGEVVLLGEVADDVALLERAAKHLLD